MTRRSARDHVSRHVSTRRLVTAAVVAALVLAACGDDEPASSPATTSPAIPEGLRPPVAVNAVGGSDSARAAAGESKMSADAATSDMSILPWAGFEYEVGEGLPPLPADAVAYQYPPGGDVDEPTVTALATALGVEGTPVRIGDPAIGVLWRIGPDDGTAPSLTVQSDPQLSWYYSSAWADQRVAEACAVAAEPAGEPSTDPSVGSSVETSVVGGDAVVPVSAPCPEPEPPVGVPTADEAEARARQLLTDLGEDPEAYTFETYADEWYASVTAWQMLGGIRGPVAWGFGFGAEGVMQYANGILAEPVAAGPYPLVDLDTAIARLEEQNAMWSGVARGEPMILEDSAAAPEAAPPDSAASATAVAEPPASDVPIGTSAPPEPEVATLVDVRADFWWAWDADGSVWLLPAYTFTDTEDRVHTVPAVADEYLIVQEVATSEPPVVVEPPATEPGASAPGGGEPGVSVPVTSDVPAEPVTPAPAVDPATLVGLTVADATTLLEEQGLTLRVVRQDGEDLAVTADFVESRVNVAVEGGVVTDVLFLG